MGSEKKHIQSYLIYGQNPRLKSEEIAKNFGINLNKPSPDIFIISPTQKTSIGIEQIRDLKKRVFQKPVEYKAKIIIIEKSHLLTNQAQNALLKILEEPPAATIFILEAQNKNIFLPTITSRVISFKTKDSTGIKPQKFIVLEQKSHQEALEQIAQIENYENWVNDQIIYINDLLEGKIKNRNSEYSLKFLIKSIEKCAETKKMLSANVSPKFAVINLVHHLKLASM